MKKILISILAVLALPGLRADDSATIAGATNLRLTQRDDTTPFRRDQIKNIKGNENLWGAVGFDADGWLTGLSLWEMTTDLPGRAALYYLRVNAAGDGLEFTAGGGGGGGSGDVTGPSSAVDDRLVTFDGTTGKIIQDGGYTAANLLARSNHTGTQAWSTLTGTPTTLAGYSIADAQPLDSDLSSIAALTTTSFGRGLLDDADASAARTSIGTVIGTDVQAFDSDLTSIAALTTTAFGRGVLDDADASALRTTAGVVIGTDVQAFDADLTDLADGSLTGSKVAITTGSFTGTGAYAAGTLYSGALSATAILDLSAITSGKWVEFDLDVTGSYDINGFTAYRVGYSGAAVTSISFTTGRHRVSFFHNGTALTVVDSKSELVNLASDVTGTLPASAVGSLPVVYGVAASDETTAITTGTGKVTFRMPHAMTLTSVRASVTTAPTGASIIIDINEAGSTIMTTNKLVIDATEKTSTTGVAHTLTDTALADDAEIIIDFDQVGSSVAGAGVKIWLIGTR